MLVSKNLDSENENNTNLQIQRHNLSFSPIQKEDWTQIMEEESISDFRQNDLTLALFYTTTLTPQNHIDLINIFSKSKEFQMANPEEPNAYYAELIDRDIGRTYQQIPYFKDKQNQDKIRQLLVNYAQHDPDVGYVQGMNFIAGTLVYFQVPQNQKIFNELIYKHRNNYVTGTPGLFENLAKLKFKLKAKIPQLFKHLQEIGLNDLGISFSPFYLTMMLQSTPIQYQMIILNIYQLMGQKYITKLLVAMLKLSKKALMKLKDVENVNKYIRTQLLANFFQEIEICRKEQRLIQLFFNIGLIRRINEF
ncbi:unnamed protein product (macronuclear) [Paramecium tetraurelia]|uniref:Rab-GAP TBC domain-containing protein n=1 Tax=Paramecium tetraurelia TaxID=5888 RepID=A0CZM7_PARTE|nr:uncharacterized protein GSPATT00011817001 [Paramecium tetraurelia]CAK76244.1 unnamed protein product [Paramecium tetraurelia]|eukprot:XP_001443641.1 hypothetical protein (macronuclear) [Paramecium tetraurelia strain d4-2]